MESVESIQFLFIYFKSMRLDLTYLCQNIMHPFLHITKQPKNFCTFLLAYMLSARNILNVNFYRFPVEDKFVFGLLACNSAI